MTRSYEPTAQMPAVIEPGSIVTICGSTKFRKLITEANKQLTLAGYLVFAPGVFAHDGDQITHEEKVLLDRLHLLKIDASRLVYVVNPNGYIGESTAREIAYAQQTNKPIVYLESWTPKFA